MRMRLEIRAEYGDDGTARAVFAALMPDNKGYVDSGRSGRQLLFVIESPDAGSMKNSADDLLACLKAAENSVGLVPGPAADLYCDAL